ncbi:putative metal-dependent phosphoesterase TrpH [Paenibacillus shirakamiensis]|uniref:Metal-dependent phosphoesterase TrpH n=2 Tax=Paenibacillus shirakamiensis TaxID=1265935 RepID=A0ABS4JC91_9BACL|nr:PHP domain-containing protein [Paenibacillus shirakamiensis]MBP1999337.1 putative metal-dependent phosphoesterase TrpH [Paenibacillus shirakamiensis]
MQRQGRCDLHTHTLASDGTNSPTENVRLASQKGLAGLAITDHDTVAGIAEAMEAGIKYGIRVVAGVEISTRSEGHDIHVLGYGVQYEDSRFLTRLAGLRGARDQRNDQILNKLRELGIDIVMQDVIQTKTGGNAKVNSDNSIGRPHIADTLVKKGYASDLRDAFDRYLGEGAAAYISLSPLSPTEACQWIREAGGAPVIAHPGLYHQDWLIQNLIEEARPAGLEVYHSDHQKEDEERYFAMARENNLIITGGSDYHGVRQGHVFHGDIGSITVSKEVIDLLLHT